VWTVPSDGMSAPRAFWSARDQRNATAITTGCAHRCPVGARRR
jgi:hypothetical protein